LARKVSDLALRVDGWSRMQTSDQAARLWEVLRYAPACVAQGTSLKPQYISLPLIFVTVSPLMTVSMRYLTGSMENMTQNALRISSGAAVVVAIALFRYRRELLTVLRSPRLTFMLTVYALGGIAVLYTWIEGLSMTSAAMGPLVGTLATPLTVILAATFFADERRVVTRARFIVGVTAALIATIGTTVAAPDADIAFSRGVLWLLTAVVIDSVRSMLLKPALKGIHPFAAGSVTSVVIGAGCTVLAIGNGELALVSDIPLNALVVAVVSGVAGVLMGVAVYLAMIKAIGITQVRILTLICPVLTAVLAYFLIDDTLSAGQLFWAPVVLFGCWLCFTELPATQSVPADEGQP
jgi:drug/metabolite transporter (DMT)-like permease